MSGIYIPGMVIPRCCMDCHYHISLRDQCILTHRDQRDLWSRPDWCPIVPVPDHGRLIDADTLEAEFEKLIVQDNWYYNALHHAPTIIPAEEGET